MSKKGKIIVVILSILLATAVIIVLLISPIAKYTIEKYDYKFTGRQIHIGRAYLNPFTGYLQLNNVIFHESESDSVFLKADVIHLDFSLIKLFSKTYEISELTIDHPVAYLLQTNHELNFKDLIEKFSSPVNKGKPHSPVHFNLLNLNIIDGVFYYYEDLIPINYYIKKVNISCKGIHWDADTIATEFSFQPGIGTGKIKGDMTVNIKNNNYHFAVLINKLNLDIIGQYLKELTNYGTFSANLDADIQSSGNFLSIDSVSTSGTLKIKDFHFGKDANNDYASFKSLTLAIQEISLAKHQYFYDSISVIDPYIKYERYDYLDNIQSIFGKDGNKIADVKSDKQKFNLVIEIAEYVKKISSNFFSSHFKIGRIAVYNGNLKFSDYSLNEKFSAALTPLYIIADSIDKEKGWVEVALNSGLKPYGDLKVNLNINPKDSGDFDLNYKMQQAPLALFNPYLIAYTSFPVDRGIMESHGSWHVRNGKIASDNHLIIIDPRVAKRISSKGSNWIPMKLVMAFVKERNNVMDYQIPISGDLNDPKFHLKDVVKDILKNIYIKPVTSNYRIDVKSTELQIENYLSLKWDMRRSSLTRKQIKFTEKLADFLHDHPEASITISPHIYSDREREYILYFEAKKKYYYDCGKLEFPELSNADSVRIEKFSVKDAVFVKYLDEQTKGELLFTVYDKCSRIINKETIAAIYHKLNKDRMHEFISFFDKKGVSKQIVFQKEKSEIPFNGFSYFKLEYVGDYPKSLLEAYYKMIDYNNEEPREKYKDLRMIENPENSMLK
jgi:Domain of Unknown Function (DUF748)